MRGPERGSTATTRKRKHGDSHADAQWIFSPDHGACAWAVLQCVRAAVVVGAEVTMMQFLG
jgi:hypothetical protein